jgi:hypothetical protein
MIGPQRRKDAEDSHQGGTVLGIAWSFFSRLSPRLCVSAASLCLLLSLGSAEEKPAETKPAPANESETKAADSKPAEVKPADTPAPSTTHVDTKPTEPPKPPTDEQIAMIVWEEFSADNTWVCPFAQDFSRNDEFPERKTDWEDFLAKFAVWAPGHVFDNTEKVRNLIGACSLMDIGQGQFESELPLFVYQRLRREVPDEKLKAILAYMAFHPNEGSVIGTAPELNLDIGVGEDQIRERLQVFAVKMLGRLLGKLPWEPPAQP